MKLFLALGPGDIVSAARRRLAGKEIPETSIAFSEQIFTYCRSEKIETLAISSCPRIDQLRDGKLEIRNRPKLLKSPVGILYHINAIHYACYIAWQARYFGADIAIIDSGTTHYFLLTAFRVLGIRVAVNLHNVLWPVGFPPRQRIQRVLRSLNAWFFRNIASGAIGVSPECERQVLMEAQHRIPFFQYRCQFLTDGFKKSPAYQSGNFNIACVGRIEENKGFLDIPHIAKILQSKLTAPVVFHVCGEGPALSQLRDEVRQRDLGDRIIIHGRLERSALLELYANCHAVIVPTRSTFSEGMPQVCAEAVLSGLPVITSPVSNAFDVIGSAIVPTETDKVDSYANSIYELVTNTALYRERRGSCAQTSTQFIDANQSYSAAVNRLILKMFPK